jgi:hypothetical protein
MRRRKFIQITTAATIASAIPGTGFSSNLGEDALTINQSLLLTGFDDEQEESPSLVTDGNGEMWIYTLRRMSYPENSELISSFHFDGKKWMETEAVCKLPGQYEAPAAACAQGGQPIVAWTEKKAEKWVINVAIKNVSGFNDPYTLPGKSGKSINPVVIAPDKNRNWIAWENLHHGKLTIYISQYKNGQWSEPIIIDKGESSCFDPAIVEAPNGDLYLAYGVNHGYHQNIEMSIIDGRSLEIKNTVPVALGGGFKNRVNLNTKPALAFDAEDRLWISYENNRNAHRLDDGDNYTGDRCCAILSYQNGNVVEPETTGKWLFSGKNDHKPTFVKDNNGRLYLATHCGGDFTGNPFWQYRLSWLDPQKGWVEPATILQTSQKGVLIPPAITFDKNNNLWLATCFEKRFDKKEVEKPDDVVRSLLAKLVVTQFSSPQLSTKYAPMAFSKTQVREFLPTDKLISQFSGHPKVTGKQITVDGDVYTLIYGNLHEHSENSPCWSAGTDGTLHDDYRFGMFSEGYDFVAITDHGYSLNEVYWRKNLRLADFYNEPNYFVALPAMEWTLRSDPKLDGIQYGAGHYNVIFPSVEEGKKFIRNKHEIYSVYCPETNNSASLWKFLHEKDIDCITIPHHPADKTHPVDWNVYDERYVPLVELFQCRGNGEYPGCPREINLERHSTTEYKRAFVNYALNEKKHKLGFIASGDHNGMGVGVAALWVKELSRAGILEALKSRRCFATTGDKMIVDFRINGGISGSTIEMDQAPGLNIKVTGQRELEKVEVLRNSKVIKEYILQNGPIEFDENFIDENYGEENEVLYYYVRATQKNNALAWSSPIWIEKTNSGS